MFEPLPEALPTSTNPAGDSWQMRLLDRLSFCEVGGRNLAGARDSCLPINGIWDGRLGPR